jgi:hypothetical protein
MMMYDGFQNNIIETHWIDYFVWGLLIIAAAYVVRLLIKNSHITNKRNETKN